MKNKILGVYTHPKCGGTWMAGAFLGIAKELGRNVLYKQTALINNLNNTLQENQFNFIISQNSIFEKFSTINDNEHKGIHIVRDPRDITVSAYFSYKNTHSIEEWKQLGELRNRLEKMDFNEGLMELMKFNEPFLDLMENWNYNSKNIKEYKLEDISRNTHDFYVDALNFLGLLEEKTYLKEKIFEFKGFINRISFKFFHLPLFYQLMISEESIKRINNKISFEKLAGGRKKGQENKNSHYRSGTKGDWRKYFTEEHKSYFKSRHGNLLVKLGYEKDLNW